ncbi:hypothetical protein QFC19_008302 [Naganishia cerealis]|uniref:Uncharacterized protein n=1 Tax=Naganishia cerealis TaxID=610337 RepID=A0ACC2V3B5_9TREE|nr:hypothetical protein QFC19_008302 [Naganishia cerealis]
MPPKRQSTVEVPAAKSLLNFFDRSTDTQGSSSTAQHNAPAKKDAGNQGSKRRKSRATAGTYGSFNAPLVISDDEATEVRGLKEDVIDISYDDSDENASFDKLIVQEASLGHQIRRERKRSSTEKLTNKLAVRPPKTETVSIPESTAPDQTLPIPDQAKESSTGLTLTRSPPSDLLRQTAPAYEGINDLGGQQSQLEQALEEEEGQWNEGDEEGMGMEDLDIADEEDAFQDEVMNAAKDDNEDGLGKKTEGGEKRKRNGKQKVTAAGGCSPEIIAIDDSDAEGDDDSLGEREDVDDFDVDDDECPVCGRTFVGLRGDVSRDISVFIRVYHSHYGTRSSAKAHSPISDGPALMASTRVRQPISSFCNPAQSYRAQGEQGANDAESEREARDVKNLQGVNAFKLLMGGNKEDEDWKVAETDLKRDGKRVVGRRKAPFYKVMTGMPIAVDAFRYGAIPGIKAYFLTHAHSDHYTNLSGSWKHGPIYCSGSFIVFGQTTANLIKLMLGVDEKWVHGLPWDTPYELPGTGGVKVTVLEANHCPGSSLFLFEGKQTVNAGDSTIKSPYVGGKRIWRYLHCGDFRACPEMVLHPAIKDKKLDVVYLDTTYLNPQYCFPPQPLVIAACANLAKRTVLGTGTSDAPEVKMENGEEPDIKPYLEGQADAGMQEKGKRLMQDWLVKQEEEVKAETGGTNGTEPKKRGRTLVIMGTYSIGKERIVKGVARALNSKIYCDARKRSILLCQADPELHAMLTTDPLEATIHLVPLQTIQVDRLQPYLHKLKDHFSRVLAFRPTGWTYSPPAGTNMLPDINYVIKRDQTRTFTDAYLRPMRGSSHQFMIFGTVTD